MPIRCRSQFVPIALALALAGSCGGGGGGGPAYQIGFAAPGSSIDEDGGAADVVLVLEGPAGGVLGEPASVQVSDAGSGTAAVGAAIAYQNGPPATVAAFDYSYLAFSLIWGAIFFGELPAILSLLGIVVIVTAGVLSLPRTERSAP